MINTSIESSQIKIENLYKSIFSDTPNTNFIFKSDYVSIIHIDSSNSDPAVIEIIEQEEHYIYVHGMQNKIRFLSTAKPTGNPRYKQRDPV